jgi:hypothetical protein
MTESDYGLTYSHSEGLGPLGVHILKSRVIQVPVYGDDWWDNYYVRTRDTLIEVLDHTYLLVIL